MTSVVTPLMVDGQFYGITGVDIQLDFLQGLADQVRAFDGAGQLTVISYHGLAAGVTGHPEHIGQPLVELRDDEFEADLTSIQRGEPRSKTEDGQLVAQVTANAQALAELGQRLEGVVRQFQLPEAAAERPASTDDASAASTLSL